MGKKHQLISPDQAFLGQRLQELRKLRELTRMQLAKKMRETEQQIRRWEDGAFVPLAKLEMLVDVMGSRIVKKAIRRISSLREKQAEADELIALYAETFEEIYVLAKKDASD